MKNQKLAVSIISGGMDSAVSSFMAKDMGYDIIALHFNYQQRTQNVPDCQTAQHTEEPQA